MADEELGLEVGGMRENGDGLAGIPTEVFSTCITKHGAARAFAARRAKTISHSCRGLREADLHLLILALLV